MRSLVKLRIPIVTREATDGLYRHMDSSSDDDPSLQHVLGVIDLKDGRAVHAIAGNRTDYAPVNCKYTDCGDAIALGSGYVEAGVGALYIADIDAIEGREPNTVLVERLCRLGVSVWIDQGARIPTTNVAPGVRRVIGTESLTSANDIEHLADRYGSEDLVLSIDLLDGNVLFNGHPDTSASPLELVELAKPHNIRSFIVLELHAVGTQRGSRTAAICRHIAQMHPNVELITGGGIRHPKDIENLKNAGCHRFLIGTALHNGRKMFVFDNGSC